MFVPFPARPYPKMFSNNFDFNDFERLKKIKIKMIKVKMMMQGS